jgi:Ca2+-binding RTX toxin-like protein
VPRALVASSWRIRALRGLGVVLVACAGLLAISPGAARASTVTSDGSALLYEAAAGEQNALAVSRTATGDYDLVEHPLVVIDAPGCVMIAPNHVQCAPGDIVQVKVFLGDGDDELTIADSAYPPAVPLLPPMEADGGPGSDTLLGGAGPDVLFGGSGADDVSGAAGVDFVAGNSGNPASDTEPDGADQLDGGPGDDERIAGGPGDDRVAGGSGDDPNVDGEEGSDVVIGGPGDDTVLGGPGPDSVDGGDGADEVDVPATDVVVNDRELLGPDTLDGGAGDDRIGTERVGPFQPDVVGGGAGVDSVAYAERVDSLTITLDGRANDGQPGEGDNVLANVERVNAGRESDTVIGSAGDEALDGGPGDDQIAGLDGDDELDGTPGDGGSDRLDGGRGRDVLRGGPGDDSVAGGDGDDRGSGGGGSDSVAGDGGQDDVAGGPGFDSVAGGDGNDIVRGGEALIVGADLDDRLDGGAGDDILLGGAGDDTLDGGFGADRIGGEAGHDTVTYASRFGPVTVTFDDLPNDGEPGEGDNVARDVEAVIGGARADTLTGDARDNALSGSAGEDRLDGGAGPDALRGGTAPDVIRARDGAADVVDCGPGGDFAIVDPADRTRNCNSLDLEARRRPVAGRAAVLRTTRGGAAFRLPRARRFTPLDEPLRLPLGTTIDARSARVRLVTARNRRRGRQTAMFSDGSFSVRQVGTGKRRRLTEIRLSGGDFGACAGTAAPGGRATMAADKRRIRYVWGKGRGRYRTRGRYSAGVVRGTTWLTEDRCDGTLTRVVTGTVVVRDFTLRRTVIVRAGDSYLAPALRPRGG